MAYSSLSWCMMASLVLVVLLNMYGQMKMGKLLEGFETDCIGRDIIMERASVWIDTKVNTKEKVRHSYKTTSLGFIAMCWAHTSATISRQELNHIATQLPAWALDSGDAIVCTDGAWLFDGWLDYRKTHFISYGLNEMTGEFAKSIQPLPFENSCRYLRYERTCEY